jgi:hypothetical protein
MLNVGHGRTRRHVHRDAIASRGFEDDLRTALQLGLAAVEECQQGEAVGASPDLIAELDDLPVGSQTRPREVANHHGRGQYRQRRQGLAATGMGHPARRHGRNQGSYKERKRNKAGEPGHVLD